MKTPENKKKGAIGKEEIQEAHKTLKRYKEGKANLEQRIVDEELFWKQRHWEAAKSKEGKKDGPTSAWMFNSIVNKHADAMDSYPEAICLPREASDEENAKTITKILPVVLKQNDFEQIYSDCWWYKLKHGFCIYGVFWDNGANQGKGDVAIKKLDALNVFWEPGATDIQKSKNMFILDMVSKDVLKETYPNIEIKGETEGELKQYIYDDNIDTTDKAVVVDWYYKKGGKLHYCKFCEENVLFASENEKDYPDGWYEDGEYPVVFDVLYPEEGTAYGYGVVAVAKDPQLFIDRLDESFLYHSHIASKPRYFSSVSAGINEDEFLDLTKPIIHVEGAIDDNRLKPIQVYNVPSYMMNFRQAKIEELKEVTGNRDFVQGGVQGGVTSGAAISVLQEAGNKTTRDMVKAGYRCFEQIVKKVIERFRQFYVYEHAFRITGDDGTYSFQSFSNEGLVPQLTGVVGEEELFRKPIFDIEIEAQKMNPFSTLAQNETAMNLFNSGVLNPQNAQMAIPVIEMMTFEGKEKILSYVQEGQTLYNQLMQMQQQMEMLMQENVMLKGMGAVQGAVKETAKPPAASNTPPFMQGRV